MRTAGRARGGNKNDNVDQTWSDQNDFERTLPELSQCCAAVDQAWGDAGQTYADCDQVRGRIRPGLVRHWQLSPGMSYLGGDLGEF